MFEDLMLGHLAGSASGFFASPLNVSLSLISIALALLVLFKLNDKNLSQKQSILLVYVHLAFLFVPLVLFALSLSCQYASLGCSVTITQLLLYTLPIVFLATLIAGFLLLPRYYEKFSFKAPSDLQDFVDEESKRLNLSKKPAVFSFDSGKPFAFSLSFFKPRIFLSVGMQEVLSKKEVEAVLLHELAHIRNASSWFRFSSSLLKAFSPFSTVRNFGFNAGVEERRADSFAALRQKTGRHLKSAKKKISLNC